MTLWSTIRNYLNWLTLHAPVLTRRSSLTTSKELVAPWREPIGYVIDQFGAERCLFESNYPVDKRGAGYVVLWNAFKRATSDYTSEDRLNLFHNTAARAYRINLAADD
jgi:L-fuconolactonase